MDEQRNNTRKTVLSLLIVFASLAVVVFLLFLGPAFVSGTMPTNSYLIQITGLSGLAVNGTATVMVPVPANAEGVLVISEEALTGDRRPSRWQTAVRETPYGRMLAFTTTEGYAPDIFVSFSESEKRDEPRLLVPVLATPGNASVADFARSSGGTYTTVVFLDGLIPPQENATAISFDLSYWGGGGRKHLVKEDIWATTVSTTVPSTTSGFVPVPADYYVTAGGIMPL